eukprot:8483331-Ditylum_brightwellii.AAC.1
MLLNIIGPCSWSPQGYFSKNSGDKIENKVLLVATDRSDINVQFALGRGGPGPGIFIYAILDW